MKLVAQLQEFEGLICEMDICGSNCLTIHQLSESLGNAVDAKDHHTYNHSQHVAVISYLLAMDLGLKPKQADMIHIAGHLHDIGKVAVPDTVLKKHGRLTEDDWKWMKKHPEAGAKIVSPVKAFKSNGGIWEIILCHHERYDGKGYPQQLQGKEIPIGARIIAVADTLSAIIQNRYYRKSRPFEEAVEEIVRHSGTQFDPLIVNAFVACQDNIRQWLEGI